MTIKNIRPGAKWWAPNRSSPDFIKKIKWNFKWFNNKVTATINLLEKTLTNLDLNTSKNQFVEIIWIPFFGINFLKKYVVIKKQKINILMEKNILSCHRMKNQNWVKNPVQLIYNVYNSANNRFFREDENETIKYNQ